MISYIFPLIYLILLGLAGSIIFGYRKFGSALPFSIMLHVLIVILSGLFLSDLRPGLVGGVLCIAVIIKAVAVDKKGRELLWRLLSADTALFAVLYVVLLYMNTKQVFHVWDEFSHWGPMAKEMIRLDDFYFKSDRSFAHRDYVPFLTVFEYTLCKCRGGYREILMYQSAQIFILSLFLPAVSLIGEKISGIKGFCMQLMSIVLYFASMTMLGGFLHSVYLDIPLGLLCGFGMVYSRYGRTGGCGIGKIIFESVLITSSVIMTKMIGIIFLPVFVVMNMLILLDGYKIGDRIKLALSQTFIPLIIWFLYKTESTKFYDASGNQSFGGASEGLIQLLKNGFTKDYQKQVSADYIRAVFADKPIIGTYGTFSVVLAASVCLLLAVSLLVKNKASRKKDLLLTLAVVLTGIYFAVVMYFMYMVSFSEFEASRLASFERYMSQYSATIFYVIDCFIIGRLIVTSEDECGNMGKDAAAAAKGVPFSVMMICCTAVLLFYDLLSGALKSEIKGYFVDHFYHETSEYKTELILDKMGGDGDSLLMISQGEQGFHYIRINYFIMDSITRCDYGSYRLSGTEKDSPYDKYVTLEELSDIYARYDYVLADTLDEDFVTNFASLFDKTPGNDELYRVVRNVDDVRLEFVANIYE